MTAILSAAYAAGAGNPCIVNELSTDLLGPTAEERQVLAEVKGDLRALRPLSATESKAQNAAVINAKGIADFHAVKDF